MVKKKHQRKISLWLAILMVFSVFTGFIPAVSAESTQNGFTIHDDVKVTFTQEYDGEELYLVGSFNEWDIANAPQMEKVDGVFKVTKYLAPGEYEYKFSPERVWGGQEFPTQNLVVTVPGESTANVTIHDEVRVTFTQEYNGETLYLVGSFNGWNIDNAIEMQNNGGVFTTTLDLLPGNYEYKFNPERAWGGQEFPAQNLVVTVPERGVVEEPQPEVKPVERYVQFVYDRPDGVYEGWNMWVWGTGGASDGQVNIAEVKDGKAYFRIDVSETAEEVGFVLRSTDDWETAEKDVDPDRFITLNSVDPITKVYVTSGEVEFLTVPEISAPFVENGNAQFFFRDKELYANNAMGTIEKVELSILGERFEMTQEADNERFVYTYENIDYGVYPYSFFVTINGVETEVTDPYNTVDGASELVYVLAEVGITASVYPEAIDYNQNAVVTIALDKSAEVEVRELYIDATAIGGPEKLYVDPELNEVTISVDQSTPAGLKTLPVVAVDQYGSRHEDSVTVEVKALTSVGEGDFDWDEAVIYFMLTDRFFDGDESNNDPYGIGYDTSKSGTYQGGDFKGITQKLDYLDQLGINTIWINPVVENIKYDVRHENPDTPYYGYHGYWASNFGELNPHLGTMVDFHELIDEAHARGMKIMVDVVLNHTGYGLKATDNSTVTNFPTDEDRARFDGMLRSGGSDTVRGELAGLPDFITEDPTVRDQIVQWQVDWIEKSRTASGNTIDYFRVDTVKHVEDTTWMKFKNELTKQMPEFKMIGEAWGAGHHNDYGYLNTGIMDSLLDFEFKGYAHSFVNGELDSVHQTLVDRNSNLTNGATLGQFLGSHDENGFLHSVNGDTGKLKVAAALQITAKGQPVIYYGEELGLTGEANYPYYTNRQNLPWDQVDDNDILGHYQNLLAFRSDFSDVFAKGDRTQIAGSDTEAYHLFGRSYKDQTVYVGLNVAGEAKEVTLPVNGEVITDHYSNTDYTVVNGEVTFTIPAMADGGTVLLTVDGGTNGIVTGGEEVTEIPENHLRVHYQRADQAYDGLGLWNWGDVATPSETVAGWPDGATAVTGSDDYGVYYDIELTSDARNVNFLVNNKAGTNLTGDLGFEYFSNEIKEVWIKEGSSEVFLWEPVELPENTVRIHYEREDGNYDGWAAWIWGDVATASDGWPNGATDLSGVGKHGAYYDIELTAEAKEMGFLFVNKDGSGQTGDLSFAMLDQYNHIFVKDGEDMAAYTNPYGAVPVAMLSAEHLSDTKVELKFSKTEGLTVEELLAAISVKDNADGVVAVTEVTIKDETTVELAGDFNLEMGPYVVTYEETSVTARAGWRMIDEMYAYDGELGPKLNADGTATIKLWSPKADSVSIILYDKDDQNVVQGQYDMTLGDRGVWSLTLDKDNTGLESVRGYFYHYAITHGDETKIALDPYAKSMAAWSHENVSAEYPFGKAAIIDPSTIGPELDYANIPGFEKREDTIIYEVHVRDLTSDPNIEDELTAQFGTFAAFVERLDYIESLGVTHIQLLPIMSYFFGDELANGERMLEYQSTNTNFNWGYDPHSYFSVSGMYSEDPTDPEKRIEEFKNLIHEIHSRDMGVILDVVYNHTARVGIFEDLVPNYYHFMDADGTPRTSFGGGRLGTTHEMARKILVDSITYWVDEFKVDGFRFDMMGDHDAESIQIAFDKAKELNPNIVMIGEGWRTFAGDEGSPVQASDQDWMQYTEAVGSFSDEFRNELKSGFGSEGQPRFLTGGARNVQQILDNIKAQPHNFTADDPGDVVPYIAAHDNLTLYDVIAQSIKKDPDIAENNLEIHKRIRIGNAMVLTSQGTAFIHAGQEFGRTKQWRGDITEVPYKSTYMEDADGNPFTHPYFIHDSYDSSDIINRMDWEKATNAELYPINNLTREYTTGLIALRRSTDAFRLGEKDLVDQNVTMVNAPEIKVNDLVIAYRNEATNGDAYYVFVNADNATRTLTLSENLIGGTVVVDNDEAGTTEVSARSGFALSSNQITIDPLTTIVIKVNDAPAAPSPITPAPTPQPETPVEEVVVNNPQADNSGKVSVVIGQGDKVVKLPAQAEAINRNNKVNIERDDFSMEVPGAVLESLKDLGKDDSNSNISVSFEKQGKEVIESSLVKQGAAKKAGIRSAGDIFEFNLSVVGTNGEAKKLSSFEEPVRVKLKISDGADLDLVGIYRVEEDGQLTYVGGDVDGQTISTDLYSFSKYAVLEYDKSYEDVAADYWAHDTIKKLSARHIMTGYTNGDFAPRKDVTRAEFVAMIVRALNLNTDKNVTFSDVSSTAWYAKDVAAAYEAGIVKGNGNQQFAPDEVITREQMTAMIVRAYEVVNGPIQNTDGTNNFADGHAVSSWAKDYVNHAATLNLVQGKGNGNFSPLSNANRAESAQIVYNLLFN